MQEQVDVAADVETVYDQFTQFADWPQFMHRVEEVEQKDDATVMFHENVWGVRRAWEADIVEQIPCERLVWRSTGPLQTVSPGGPTRSSSPNGTPPARTPTFLWGAKAARPTPHPESAIFWTACRQRFIVDASWSTGGPGWGPAGSATGSQGLPERRGTRRLPPR